MNKTILFLCLTVLIATAQKATATNCHGESAASPAQTAVSEPLNVGNKICPVMGGPVDPKVTYTFEGKIYNFCCPACIEEFKKDPQTYIEKIEGELQGK